MHLVQAKTLFPSIFAYCRLGYLLTFDVGLYLPLSFTRVTAILDDFPQIVQVLAISLLK